MKKLFLILCVLTACFMQTAKASTNVSGDISTNTVWVTGGSPYIVTSYITVDPGVTLTVNSGVSVKFNDGQYMIVSGKLIATGATFTSSDASPTPGVWSYIQVGNIGTNDTGNVVMSGCSVQYASTFIVSLGKATLSGSTNLSNFYSNGVDVLANGVFKMTGGSINTSSAFAAASCFAISGEGNTYDTLSGVNIQHYQYGIYMQLNDAFDITSSTITNCTYPIWYNASAALTLHGTNVLTGNTNSFVNFAMSDIPNALVLPTISLPYFSSTLTIDHGASLTIPSGSTYKFANGAYLYVNGHLNATSTTFTSINSSPNPGDWGYIQVGGGNLADSGYVKLSSCQINYGSYALSVYNGKATISNTPLSNTLYSGVVIDQNGTFNMTGGNIITISPTALASYSGIGALAGSHITISGVTIQNYQYGIWLDNNAKLDMTTMTISGCNWPIYYANSADLTVHGTNTLTGNTNSLINLAMSNISDTLILPSLSLPYYANSITINHGGWLSIPSGSTYEFANGTYLWVNGHLTATTTTFTSVNSSPNPGDWGYIQVGGGNPSDSGYVKLTSCNINYGLYGLYVYNGKASISNTPLSNSYYSGVVIDQTGIFNMTGSNIITNSPTALASYSGIEARAGSHSTISGVTIQNYQYGIFLSNNAKVDMTTMTISGCNWPIYYTNSADLTVHSTINLAGNTNSSIFMGFSTLTDTLILPVLSLPYYFQGSFTVNSGARLVISDNDILKFPNGTALDIYGVLVANASVVKAIYFTSLEDDNWGGDTNNDGSASAPAIGNWYGIRFFDSSLDASCIMRRCQVRYAGYGNTGGIQMTDASPTIDNCNISFNYFGIYMVNASAPVISNNTIGASQMTPVAMSFEANPTMTNNAFSSSGNTYDAIGLLGGTLTANAVIKKRNFTTVQNITYVMLDQIIVPVGKTLTINKGIVIKGFSTAQRIWVQGTLTANATYDSLITFTSIADDNYGNPGDCNKDGNITVPAIGDWGGITFDAGSTGTLKYCRIQYATNNYYWWYGFPSCSTTEYLLGAGVETIDASPSITYCQFNNLNYAIVCHRVSNPILEYNTFTNITYTPVNISSPSNPTFLATGDTYTNVKWNAIGLLSGTVCQNGTIKKRNVAGYTNITYVLLGDMTINGGTQISVDPDVVIKMNGCNIYVDGGFQTNGTSGHPVTFTSLADDNAGNPFDSNGDGNATSPSAGNWGCIKFRATSDDSYCKLNYTNINYGGASSEGGVCFENAGGQMNNCTISNTSNYGIYCNGSSTPTLNTVIIQNCSSDPFAMSLLSNPAFTNITFAANGSKAIKIIEGTLSSNATLAPRNVAGITNIAYIINTLTIASNAKLTILPGVVIKFRAEGWCPASYLSVNGNLIANGTPSNKIYFTSFADDSKGGDSNNDGNATAPATGDWGQAYWWCYNIIGGIKFINNSFNADTVNSLKNCEISYAATALRIENSHVTIDSCLIQLCSSYGATILGSSNPDIKYCQFYNIPNSPIELSMFSTPTFTSCTGLNVGLMALSVIPETYSQNATVPIRNFGGYSNISYYMEGACTINSGTTITIPAGITFKADGTSNVVRFTVNGRLNIMGTVSSPVIFSDYRDDNVGNPLDMNQDGSATVPPDGINQGWSGTWLSFPDISNDSSTVRYATFKYGNCGIGLTSASPAIKHVRFENLNYGVDLNGVSTPKIDSCVFNNLQYYPMQISLVSYPSSTLNDSISGTTYKVIKVRDETLTQDVTLPKRAFGVTSKGPITNIPYFFHTYTIGTGATLTINPGIVCKFYNEYWWIPIGFLDINKGLNAIGGSTPDSNIVFTDVRDDFYGGDSNSDSTASSPTIGSWSGLHFEDQSLDPLCHLKNCIIRYADKAIQTTSASPLLEKCNINNNNYGVYATAASNPVFHNCDFEKNYYWSVDNVDKSYNIDATNCWWGSNLGPIQTNTQGNGTSPQELVTTFVNYSPYKTTGAGAPLEGDVSLNGIVQAYDASLVLQYVVGNITLTNTQKSVADVSFNGTISSLDASLILQYVVGIIPAFPAEIARHINPMLLQNTILTVGSMNATNGQDVTVPLSVSDVSGMLSADIKLHYDPTYLQVANVTSAISGMNLVYNNDNVNGILTIAIAGTNSLFTDTVLANVTFHASIPAGTTIKTDVDVLQFYADENDMTSAAIPGIITITDAATGLPTAPGDYYLGMDPVYPNPSSDGNAMLTYHLNSDKQFVQLEVYNMMGQKVVSIVNETQGKGSYSVPLSANGNPLNYGSYIIRMTADNFYQTQMFQIVK